MAARERVAALVGAVFFVLGASAAWGGSESSRWAVAISIPTRDSLDHPKAASVAELSALPGPPGGVPKERGGRVPPFPNPAGLSEGEIVRIEARIAAVAKDGNETYRVWLAGEGPAGGRSCVAALLPDPTRLSTGFSPPVMFDAVAPALVTAQEIAPLFRDGRKTLEGSLLHGAAAPANGSAIELHPPASAWVTGQLFYDPAPDLAPPRDTGCGAPARWAIAPVTRLQLITHDR